MGKPKEVAKKLVINTWECLEKAINEVKPGVKFRDVGNVIQKHAQSEGFSVVRSYCGHGEYLSRFKMVHSVYNGFEEKSASKKKTVVGSYKS